MSLWNRPHYSTPKLQRKHLQFPTVPSNSQSLRFTTEQPEGVWRCKTLHYPSWKGVPRSWPNALPAQMQPWSPDRPSDLSTVITGNQRNSKCFSAQDCIWQRHCEAVEHILLFCGRQAELEDPEHRRCLGKAWEKDRLLTLSVSLWRQRTSLI